MKNKHLVLLFLGIVALGWIGQYVNWGKGTELKVPLFKQAIANVHKIQIIQKDSVTLFKTDEQWMVDLEGTILPVPDSVSMRILTALSNLESIRLLHTTRPDTIGMRGPEQIRVTCFTATAPQEQVLLVGRETYSDHLPATWVTFSGHEQYYLSEGALREALLFNWYSLLQPQLFQADTTLVASISLFRESDTLLFSAPAAVPEGWLQRWFDCVHKAPQFEFFDTKASGGRFFGEVCFSYQNEPESPVCYRLFYLDRPDLPEDPQKRRYFRHFKPQYLLEATQDPGVFYSITDTMAVGRLFR